MDPVNPNPTAPASAPAEAPAAAEPKLPMGTTPTRQQRNTPPAAAEAKPETPANGTEEQENEEEAEKPKTTPPAESGQEDEAEIDYKVKFSASSKEAQRLLEVLKANGIDPETGKPMAGAPSAEEEAEKPAIQVRGEQPTQPEIPLTDEQLTKAIPGFANLTEGEKDVIRNTKTTAKNIVHLTNLVTEMYDERVYNKEFKDLSGKKEWARLAEFAEEFKEYAYKPENLKVKLETLAASFLYGKGTKVEKPKPTPASGLEPGSGGGKSKNSGNADGYTADEMAEIRRTDPRRYNQLARDGKLKLKS